MEKIIICPQCRSALKVPEKNMDSLVECPQCTCKFRPNEEPCIVDEQRIEAAAMHAHDAVLVKK